MAAFKNLLGSRFGMLRVTALATRHPPIWQCTCDCGGVITVSGGPLNSGNTKSCGCRKRAVLGESTTKHGLRANPLYSTWKGMRTRCSNKNVAAYKDYGGRGIKVCARWDDFAKFVADMGECPVGHSLERRKNSEGYTPSNCYWADRTTQNRNARSNVNLTVGTLTQCMSAWASERGISKAALAARLERGWPVEAACLLPPRALPKKGKKLDIYSSTL